MILLKDARKAKGMTQEQLAERCGVARSTIAMIETGTNKPSTDLAKTLAKELDVKWWDLYEED